ncbi:MFS transporter [Actinomycetes bacterium KLBMP 9797]
MSFTSDWRDVYVAASARGAAVTAELMAATALALALQSAGAGGLAVSGLLLAAALPLVVLAPVTGWLVDRVDSRILLVTAGLAQTAVCAALAFVERPAAIVALVALLATGLAVTQPTFAALLPTMVRRDDLPRAAGANQTITSAGLLAAPALAGVLTGQFGVRAAVLTAAVGYLWVVGAAALIRTRRGGAHAVAPVAAADEPARWRLFGDPLLRAMVIAVAGTLAGVGAINVIAVFFIRETLDASATAYGLVETAWTAGLVVGAWVLARAARRARDDGALVWGMLVMLAGTSTVVLSAALVPAVAWLAPLWLVGGVLNGGENIFSNVLMGRRAPDRVRGRAFATLTASTQGASMIGFFLGGLLLEWLAPRAMVALAGAVGLAVVALVVLPVRRAIARERHTPHDQGVPEVALAA